MKAKYFKYLFIIFAIAILIYAIYKIKKDDAQQQENTNQEPTSQSTPNPQELKLGIASFDSINPIISKNKNVQDISKLIFEPLMTITKDYKAEPCLAKECVKQSDTVYLLKLKGDKKWSNGETFTADDVRFTIDRLKDTGSVYDANVAHITQVEVVDSTTVRITLDQEVPFFEYYLTFPIMSNKYYSDKEFNSDIVPVGTGMYKVSDVQSNLLVLTKNDYYADVDKIKLEKINVTLYSSIGELYNAFKTGGIDLIGTDNTNIKDYIGTIGYQVKEMKGRSHDFIAFNTQGEVLSDVNVRKAISYSIDKSNIVSSIYGDKYYTSSFPLDYGTWVYQEQDSSLGYNLEQAKQILVDNGWTYRNKVWQKTVNYKTQRINLNFVVKATDATKLAVAQNIKAQLENQGIRINLIQANDAQYQNYLATKNYDMILCGINLSISPDMTTFFGANNLANYSNDEVTNLMTEVKNSTDDEKIKQDYKRLGEIYKSEAPYVSLYTNKYTVAYSTSLGGTVEPNWFYQFYNIEEWSK